MRVVLVEPSSTGWLKRAGMALYEAKVAGRIRVVNAEHAFVSPSYSSTGRLVRGVSRDN